MTKQYIHICITAGAVDSVEFGTDWIETSTAVIYKFATPETQRMVKESLCLLGYAAKAATSQRLRDRHDAERSA